MHWTDSITSVLGSCYHIIAVLFILLRKASQNSMYLHAFRLKCLSKHGNSLVRNAFSAGEHI